MREAWRTSRTGRVLAALARVQAAVLATHAAVDALRASLARRPDAPIDLGDLERRAADLTAAIAAARLD